MRVLFVRQSKPHFELNVTHPLGLMCVAARARQLDGVDATIIDNRLLNLPMDRLVEQAEASRPDVIAATALTLEAPELHEFLAACRARMPGAFQVVGGIHATNFPEAVLRGAARESIRDKTGAGPGGADLVVIGEGEQTLFEALDALKQGYEPKGIDGTARFDRGTFVLERPRSFIEDLDSLPWPAYDLIPVTRYFGRLMGDLIYNRPEQMSMQTSRGCPYGCSFCHNLFGRGFRPRSAGSVLDEMQMLAEDWGVREIHIQDDVFNLDLARAKAICQGIIDRGLDLVLAFPNGLRGDRMDDELFDLLWAAGTRRIAFAVETVDPQMQRRIGKNLDVEKVRQSMAKAAELGMLVKGFFMLGFPGETEEQMLDTIEFARESRSHVANFSRVVPNPSTELGREVCEKEGGLDYRWEDYTYDYSEINLSAVSNRRFERLLRRAYRRYMWSSWRIRNLLGLFPNKLRFFWRYSGLLYIKLFVKKTRRPEGRGKQGPIRIRY